MLFNGNKPIIVISDIHANLPGLEAVLNDINMPREAYELLFLGDLFGYGPMQNQVYFRIRELHPDIWLSGNHDKALERRSAQYQKMNPTAKACIDIQRSVTRANLQMDVAKKPVKMTLRNLVCSHGFPLDDDAGAVEAYDHDYQPEKRSGFINKLWHSTYPDSILWLMGHSHVQRFWWQQTATCHWVKFPNGSEFIAPPPLTYFEDHSIRRQMTVFTLPKSATLQSLIILNPGSVGLPREGVVSETGDKFAQYAMINPDGDSIRFEFISVSYSPLMVREWWREAHYPIEKLEKFY